MIYTPYTDKAESINHRFLSLINIARIALLLSLLVLQVFSTYSSGDPSDVIFPALKFYSWAGIYAFLILLTAFRTSVKTRAIKLQNTANLTDISMMMALVYIAGGLDSGFGILVLPFIATSCLLSHGRHPLLYANYAAVLFLLNLFFDNQGFFYTHNWQTPITQTTILLVSASYPVAILTSLAAHYLEQATESANRHEIAYNRIRGLNRLVLNRVQEAVVVIDEAQTVWLFNQKAKTYFPKLEINRCEPAFEPLIQQWRKQPDRGFETNLQFARQEMLFRTVPLIQEHTEFLILYIRSWREVEAEALSNKLTSLGQLTANLAHEIRNPMSAIRHANSLLQDDEDTDPVKSRLYGIIDNNISRIDKMLEDISTLNKRDNIRRETINLMRFWMNFKQEFLLTNPDASGCIRIRTEDGRLNVGADPLHLQQIMWNLCNNAWRHSRKDQNAIVVSVRMIGQTHVSLTVSDNGKGVAPAVRARLFEPFHTTEKQGTGLGLYVARELAHANLGQLQHVPERNGFELILPREQHD